MKQEVNAAWKSGELDIKSLCASSQHRRHNGTQNLSTDVHRQQDTESRRIHPHTQPAAPFERTHLGCQSQGFRLEAFCGYRRPSPAFIIPALRRRCQIAKEQVFAFVAILVHRFDIAMKKGKRPVFPRIDFSVLASGIPGPAKSMDPSADLGHLGTDA